MSWIRPIIFHVYTLLMVSLLCPVQSWAVDLDKVSRIKAAYIHQFSHFVSWPGSEAVASSSIAQMTICIIGHDLVSEYLAKLAGHRHGAYSIEIEHPTSPSAAHHCELLYITPRSPAEVDEIVREMDRFPVLTVSDVPGFVDRGGMIGFIVKEDRVRLEINLPAAQRARLHISAKLIEVSLRIIRVHANEGGR